MIKRLLLVVIMVLFTTTAFADVVLNKKIDNVRNRVDKNGKAYTMLIFTGTQELEGIKYERDTMLFAFGPMHEQVKNLKKGDTIKCIAAERNYNGQKTYNILKVLK